MSFIYKLTSMYKTTIPNSLLYMRISKIFSTPKTSLGRWGAIENKQSLDRRIDMANEDHCGPCGQLYMKPKGPKDE